MAKLLIAVGLLLVALPLFAFSLGISNTDFGPIHVLVTMAGLVMLSIGTMSKGAADSAEPPLPPRRVLVIACCLGLVTGLGEASVLAIEQIAPELMGRSLSYSQHWLWMQPLADLSLFALAGMVFVLAGGVFSRARSTRSVVWTFVFLGASSILLGVARLHDWAALVLAAGLALVSARRVAGRSNAFYGGIRRVLPWAIALSALVGMGVYAWRAVPEWLAAPGEHRRNSPNVLIIVLDTVRAQSLELYGNERPTMPHLNEFSRRAVVFDRALSTAPWTLPSHASMFTGRSPRELFPASETPLTGVVALDSPHPLLAEILGSLGYETVGIVANTGYCSRAHGLSRGFSHYEDYPVSLGWFLASTSVGSLLSSELLRALGSDFPSVRKSAADVNHSFLAWLEHRSDAPFFAFLNYYDAHKPYVVPKPFEVRYGNNDRRHLNPGGVIDDASSERCAELRDGYDSCLLYLDHHLGLLLDELQEQGVLDNTVTIITSDHGEQFGEHGLFAHSNTVYRQALQVPLLVSFPEHVPAGLRIDAPVSLRDLPASIFDLADLPVPPNIPGSSLAYHWDRDASATGFDPSPILSEVLVGARKPPRYLSWFPGYDAGLLSLVAKGFHYIRYRQDDEVCEELYDFNGDPLDERDLAGTDEGAELLDGLRQALDAVLADTPARK